jgi:hydrogenase maturation protease
MPVTVVGFGQPGAGDDGAGPAVLEALRRRGLPRGVRALALADPSALVPLLEAGGEVIVVDAVVGAPLGAVLELDSEDLDPAAPLAVSSHGIGVQQAIALARVLAGDRSLAHTRILGVGIERPVVRSTRLSPKVAAAIPRAADAIGRMLDAVCGPAPDPGAGAGAAPNGPTG